MPDAVLPWLPRALQALDLRRKDRLLLALPGQVAVARAVAQQIGPQGALTVLEPRRKVAEAIAEALPAASVLLLNPGGDAQFGTFDAILSAPLQAPPIPVADWAALAAANLRPGGRFALDLPAPDPLPDVREAARTAQLPFADRLAAALSGPEEQSLTAALLSRGMRRVETLLGTHLLQFGSPFDFVDLIGAAVPLDEDERIQLGEALARRLQSTTAVETLAYRSAVAGMR